MKEHALANGAEAALMRERLHDICHLRELQAKLTRLAKRWSHVSVCFR